jgi:hypothetical protein
MGSLVRALVLFVVLLLEPAERSFSNAATKGALVLLVLGLALIARKAAGAAGLVAIALVALLGAVFVGWKIL